MSNKQQLVIRQIEIREDPILRKCVVTQKQAVEELSLSDVLLLLETGEKEVELGLECSAGPIAVEVGEKGVVDILEDLHPFETPGQHLDQRGLAGADGAIDGEVVDG